MLFIYYILLFIIYYYISPRIPDLKQPLYREKKIKKNFFSFFYFPLYIVTFGWETWDSGRNRAKTARNHRKMASALSCLRFFDLFFLKLCCHTIWDSGRNCPCIWENQPFCPQKPRPPSPVRAAARHRAISRIFFIFFLRCLSCVFNLGFWENHFCKQKKPGLSPRAMSCYLKWYVIVTRKCALFIYVLLYVCRCLFKAWFWFGLWLVSFFFFLIRFHYRHF